MKQALALLAVGCLTLNVQAERVLYDFEQAWEMEEWRVADETAQQFARTAGFATSGRGALHFKAEPGAQCHGHLGAFWKPQQVA